MSDQTTFNPSPEFSAQSNIKSLDEYRSMYERAKADPERFWGDLAAKELTWFRPFAQSLEWDPPQAKWFAGGKINAAYNCIDRHLETDRKTKPAIVWEGEPGDRRTLTYEDLYHQVCRFTYTLMQLGCRTGDRAVIYMPMVPELPIAVLACARMGMTHSVVFGGFSAEALKVRIRDLQASVVITADGGWRRGKEVPLKAAVDEALLECPSVKNVVVYRRTASQIVMQQGRDFWWDELERELASTPPGERSAESAPAQDLDSE